METPTLANIEHKQIINHHKEVHSFYIFTAMIVFGILILHPISMVLLIVTQSLMQ